MAARSFNIATANRANKKIFIFFLILVSFFLLNNFLYNQEGVVDVGEVEMGEVDVVDVVEVEVIEEIRVGILFLFLNRICFSFK